MMIKFLDCKTQNTVEGHERWTLTFKLDTHFPAECDGYLCMHFIRYKCLLHSLGVDDVAAYVERVLDRFDKQDDVEMAEPVGISSIWSKM